MLPDTQSKQPKKPESITTPRGAGETTALIENKNIKGMLDRGGYKISRGLDNQIDVYNPSGNRGYWENPARIARYHNYIRAQEPGWQAPEWLPAQQIEAAYNYMKYRNGDKPWYEWKYLNEDDSATQTLRGLDAPPVEYLYPAEVAEIAAKQKEAEAERQAIGS